MTTFDDDPNFPGYDVPFHRYVTPAKAQEFLALNDEEWNRAARDRTVERYKRLMLSGKWKHKNPHGIVIYRNPNGLEDDKLTNGQRRMMAVVRAGLAKAAEVAAEGGSEANQREAAEQLRVGFWFSYTDDPELASAAIDKGDQRTPTDELRMLRMPDGTHVPYADLVAGTLRLLYKFENDPMYAPGNRGDGYWPTDPDDAKKPKRPDPSWTELEEIFSKDPVGIAHAVTTGRVQGYKIPTKQMPRAVICALNYQFQQLDETGAQHFWALLSSPSAAEVNTGPWALHELLENHYQSATRIKERPAVAFLRKAWASYRDPTELVRRMRFAATDSFPGLAG